MNLETLIICRTKKLRLSAWATFIKFESFESLKLRYICAAFSTTIVQTLKGFISIDCGAAKDYYDEDTGIFYQSDTGFIDTGTSKSIPSALINSHFRQQLKNLRSFPHGTKNCYTLKPEQGKNNNYMVRAFFWYGNHDGNNQPPIFDLYLGVNKWDTVNSSSQVYLERDYSFFLDG
ncbi:hypothetical protein L1049_004072 [Liquidambar formosana]|uniref:Malectin-like domain-containing protein n=1 Tax=Liquidambar formosana TaxID=63359 RepID=A0AAP0RRH6_LIQFO